MKFRKLFLSVFGLCCACTFSSMAVKPEITSLEKGECFFVSNEYFDMAKKVGAESCLFKKGEPDRVSYVLCKRDSSNKKILWVAPVVSELNDRFDVTKLGYKKVISDGRELYVSVNNMIPILESDIDGMSSVKVSKSSVKSISKLVSRELATNNSCKSWNSLCLLRKIADERVGSKLSGQDLELKYKEVKKTPKKAHSIKPYSKEFFDLVDDCSSEEVLSDTEEIE